MGILADWQIRDGVRIEPTLERAHVHLQTLIYDCQKRKEL